MKLNICLSALYTVLLVLGFSCCAYAQQADEKSQAILAKAVSIMGGDNYLQIKTQVGKGRYTLLGDRGVISSQTFLDVVVLPDKDRTEFKGGGTRTIQTNSGTSGWIYDSDLEVVKLQTPAQVDNFKQSIRTSLDYLLRGYWKGEGQLIYSGRRPGTLGKRNDVLKLTFSDGFAVEFEFADDGTPQKAAYKRTNAAGEEIREEDRYAQFVDAEGIKTPFIIDRFTDGHQVSRINYDSVEFNRAIPDSAFAKPASPKEARKDIKL
jgi:hypothetical protein